MRTARLLDHWLPPEGAGAPVASFATTFTFDGTFFAEDCIARFLMLTGARGDQDEIADIALLLEEEEKLSEASVTVLADRSAATEQHNLRWDLIDVPVPGGLLHAKVAVMLWERATRVVIGSPNLTPAGYRNQVELALAIDLEGRCAVPRGLLDDLVQELRAFVDLAPGPADRPGPKTRAHATLDRLEERVAGADLPERQARDLRLALAPSAPGRSPLDQLDEVWRGPAPRRLTALSPFWDTRDEVPAIHAVEGRLAVQRRAGEPLRATYVVPVDHIDAMIARAPSAILECERPDRIKARCVAFAPPGDVGGEDRRLHAKCLAYESDDWVAVFVGSSNITEAGLGLAQNYGHREVNVWLRCPAGSEGADELLALLSLGEEITPDTARFEPEPPEDEETTSPLPVGFREALIEPAVPARLTLGLDPARLPARWSVTGLDERLLLDEDGWASAGCPTEHHLILDGTILPSVLRVSWSGRDGVAESDWAVNVTDTGLLPPPQELRELDTTVILDVLASIRPLRESLEQALRRQRQATVDGEVQADPLLQHDGSARIPHRARRLSAALWGLHARLGRRINSLETLEWRLGGMLGPTALAERLLADEAVEFLPGEAEFFLAELALTVRNVDWASAAGHVPVRTVKARASSVLEDLHARYLDRTASADAPESIRSYARTAFEEALT